MASKTKTKRPAKALSGSISPELMAPKPLDPMPMQVNLMQSKPDRYPGRLFEWITSCTMIGISVIVALNPKSVELGGFHYLREVGLTASVLAIIFLVAGIARIAGLFANGMWPVYGPRCRAGGAMVGVVIWAQMLYSLVLWSNKSGYLSIGVAVYAGLIIGEGVSCWRAANDVRHS